MASLRDLRDRIKSLKNTQQITKAMKQVAAAKIRRAEILRKQSRPYADAMSEMLRDLIDAVGSIDHPFMKPGKGGAPAGVILMTADKGLAGSFNSNAISAAEEYRRANDGVKWYSVGVKGRNYIRRRDEIEQYWPQSAGVKLDVAREIARKVGDDFLAGKISKITLISQHMQSMMVQRPQTRELVPVTREKQEEKSGPRGAVEFEPSPEAVLSKLLPKYLEFTVYSAMLETDAAFFAAQLIAMSNATDNAGKIIDEITLEMNKARQAAITKEILEIVGGAEALAS